MLMESEDDCIVPDWASLTLNLEKVGVFCRIYACLNRHGPMNQRLIHRSLKIGGTSRFYEAYLQTMCRAGVIKGKRGPNGGHQIIRRGLTVHDIVEAVYGEQTSPLITAWKNVNPEDV